jgi:hypothetical protein
MNDTFEQFFQSSEPMRDKYLSRLFGLFSEHVVHAWCASPRSTYEDLGRPTLLSPNEPRGHTIDFTLKHRESGYMYVAELKCELEYNNYKYLQLTHPDQLRHHTSTAFAKFLQIAADPSALEVRRGGKPQVVDGAILIWGAINSNGRHAVMQAYGFADILSLESMLIDLRTWKPDQWTGFIIDLRTWTDQLFDFLSGPATSS